MVLSARPIAAYCSSVYTMVSGMSRFSALLNMKLICCISTLVELRTITMIALSPTIINTLRKKLVMVCPSDSCTLPLESNTLRTTAAIAKANARAMPMSAMPQ